MEQLNMTTLETHGQNGFESYRIPGIITTARGTLLAYYEVRLEVKNDWSARGVALRRSTDGGKSWSDRSYLVYDADETIGNPVMIASQSGRVHFLWLKDMRQPFYQYSDDDGITFSKPISLLACMDSYRSEYDWSLLAFGPGHGIELTNGRLVVPVWLCCGEGNNHHPTDVTTIISDDQGASWKRGQIIYGGISEADPFFNPNETQAVELSDGSVMLNIRHAGSCHYRYVSTSPNGQNRFSTPMPDTQLPDPRCFGSILGCKQGILFVNCANNHFLPNGRSQRTHLTVRLSTDDAKTWQYAREIAPFGGYADIAVSADSTSVYCFFEHDWVGENFVEPQRLTFCRFDMQWLQAQPT